MEKGKKEEPKKEEPKKETKGLLMDDRKMQVVAALIVFSTFITVMIGAAVYSVVNTANAKGEADREHIAEANKKAAEDNVAMAKKAADDKAAMAKKAADDKVAADKAAAEDEARRVVESKVRAANNAYINVQTQMKIVAEHRTKYDNCVQENQTNTKAYCGHITGEIDDQVLQLKFKSEDYTALAKEIGAEACKKYGIPPGLNDDGTPVA